MLEAHNVAVRSSQARSAGGHAPSFRAQFRLAQQRQAMPVSLALRPVPVLLLLVLSMLWSRSSLTRCPSVGRLPAQPSGLRPVAAALSGQPSFRAEALEAA